MDNTAGTAPQQADSTQVTATPQSEKNLVNLVYLLQTLGFVLGITFIAAIIVNLIKRSDMTSEVARSHMRWQLRTGLWSAGWMVLGSILSIVLIGYVIILIAVVWTLWRIIKGWLAASNDQPI